MKKLLLSAIIFGVVLFIVPLKAKAQYYNYPPYIASQRAVAYAMANARYRKATARKKAKKQSVRRKKRRVSMLQTNDLKFKPELYSARRLILFNLKMSIKVNNTENIER